MADKNIRLSQAGSIVDLLCHDNGDNTYSLSVAPASGSSFAAVTSVNGQTGDVVVDAGGGGGGTDTVPGSELISGGGVTYDGLLKFTVAAASYAIAGVTYTSPQTQITLDAADATNPRVDILVFTSSSTVIAIKGDAAADPATPSYDPGTQFYAGYHINVPALATTIAAATNTLVYDENVGSGSGEWDLTTSGAGWTAASTVNPLTGTKDILATTVAAAGYAKFAPAAPLDLSAYTNGVISVPIRVVTAWANKRGVFLQWYSGTATKGVQVNVLNGSFGFDSSVLTSYQNVVIPLSLFQIPAGVTVDSLRIVVTGGAVSFRLDNIRIQGNAISQPAGISQADADTRYLKQASNLSDLASKATARTNLNVKRPWFIFQFCSAFTPSGTGVDDAKFEVPYDPDDGTSSITWTVRRISGVLKTGGGTPDIVVEKLDGTDVGTLSFANNATTAAKTSAFDLATLASGDILQMNFTDIGTAEGFNIWLMLEKAA